MVPEIRDIDRLRDSAISFDIGTPDDGAITAIFPLSGSLCVVKDRAIYAVQLADQIDPKRTNRNIPNSQQIIIEHGASNEIVSKIFLTSHFLFRNEFLGTKFDRDSCMKLSLDLTKVQLELRADVISWAAELEAIKFSFSKQSADQGSIQLPSLTAAEIKCHQFLRKAGHSVDLLEGIVRSFYGERIHNKWIDSLQRLVNKDFGQKSAFATYLADAGDILLRIRGLRNAVEHPKGSAYVRVTDFRLLANGNINEPSAEICLPGEEIRKGSVLSLMEQTASVIPNITEVLLAHICNSHVKPFSGFPIQVVELPPDRRTNTHVRFSYGIVENGQVIPFG